jgi:hypothetical protein
VREVPVPRHSCEYEDPSIFLLLFLCWVAFHFIYTFFYQYNFFNFVMFQLNDQSISFDFKCPVLLKIIILNDKKIKRGFNIERNKHIPLACRHSS